MNRVLESELQGDFKYDVPDFWEAVFDGVEKLRDLTDYFFQLCTNGDQSHLQYREGQGWDEWPFIPKEEHVLAWLQKFMDQLQQHIGEQDISERAIVSRRLYQGPNKFLLRLDGEFSKRKMDVGIIAGDGHAGDSAKKVDYKKCSWSQILIPGELKPDFKKNKHMVHSLI